MPPRSGSSDSLRTLLASVAGICAGWVLAVSGDSPAADLLRDTLTMLAAILLEVAYAMAIPLVFSTIIEGSDTLEFMRGVGRLAGKTALWIAGSSATAVTVGLVVAVLWPVSPSASTVLDVPHGPLRTAPGWLTLPAGTSEQYATPAWIAFVIVAMGLGIYRNQIEESRARLLVRFAIGVRETLALMMDWARPWIPAGIFILSASMALAQAPHFARVITEGPVYLKALAAGWAIYGLILLPAVLWLLARVHPGRYALAVAPAILAALASSSTRAILPISLDLVRRRGGVSGRVAGVTLSGCAAMQRDGQALGLTLMPLLMMHLMGLKPGMGVIGTVALYGWLSGCGLSIRSLATGSPSLLIVLIGLGGGRLGQAPMLFLVLEGVIGLLGNPITLFSHACAAAVIARSEGEANLLPLQSPNDDHLMLDELEEPTP